LRITVLSRRLDGDQRPADGVVLIDHTVAYPSAYSALLPLAVDQPEVARLCAATARVVSRFNESSYLVGRRLNAQGRTLGQDQGVDPMRYAAHGGSFPVRVRAVGVVGTVTVSGLPQADDHALVVEAIGRFLD
jgi:uncharacterized protein (UPF0303 family)